MLVERTERATLWLVIRTSLCVGSVSCSQRLAAAMRPGRGPIETAGPRVQGTRTRRPVSGTGDVMVGQANHETRPRSGLVACARVRGCPAPPNGSQAGRILDVAGPIPTAIHGRTP